jgi:LPXTG-site transpeptidase (sortase) family protein
VTRTLRHTAFYAEIAFVLAGTIFLGTASWRFLSFAAFQRYYEFALRHGGAATGPEVTGKLLAPGVGLSVVIVEGADDASLNLGAGHLPGSAAFGARGNAVVAGHRDMAFRALRNIQLGDELQIQAGKRYTYRVAQIRIVRPEDLSVLRDDGTAQLTLITCFPFTFIGDAPMRYVVQASLVQ